MFVHLYLIFIVVIVIVENESVEQSQVLRKMSDGIFFDGGWLPAHKRQKTKIPLSGTEYKNNWKVGVEVAKSKNKLLYHLN